MHKLPLTGQVRPVRDYRSVSVHIEPSSVVINSRASYQLARENVPILQIHGQTSERGRRRTVSVDVFINERGIYANEDGTAPVYKCLFHLTDLYPHARRYN